MKFNDEVVKFQANDCMIIFPDVTHYFFVDNQPAELVQSEFRMDIFPELKHDPMMEDHLAFLHNILTHSQRYLKISLHKPLMSLLERIVDELSQKRDNYVLLTRSETIKKALRIIHAEYIENSKIEHIAEKCAISARYLRKLFEKEIGLSPVEYMTILRINSSKDLLRNPSIPLKEIAFSTGFDNQQYFSKRFKQITGISPLKYRKLMFREM